MPGPSALRGPTARTEARVLRARTVGDACARPALVTHPDTSAREAARLLIDADVSRLAVVDGVLVGVVGTEGDPVWEVDDRSGSVGAR